MLLRSLPSRLRSLETLFSVLIAFALLFTPKLSRGQGYFGTVSGEITDQSGALVLGAKVTLTDLQKGFTFSVPSDNKGRYLFTAIPPGIYSVTAEMQGFEKAVRTNVKVNVSENATANLTLKVASATQSVEVTAEAIPNKRRNLKFQFIGSRSLRR